MRTFILIGVLASLARAFTVPRGLPRGLGSVELDSNASLMVEPPQPLAARTESGAISARDSTPPSLPSPVITCGSNSVNANDFVLAKQQMESTACQVDTQYPANQLVMFTSGTTTMYMCNYDTHNRCWVQEIEQASRMLDQTCGQNRAGYVYIDAYKKSYGRDIQGATVCQ